YNLKKIFSLAVAASIASLLILSGCASSGGSSSSSTTFADYFSYPTVNKNGIAYTIYNKQVAPDDMDTLSVVLLSGYTYIEQTLNHYGYIGVAVQFSNSTNKLYVVERSVFDKFLKSEIDANTFVGQLKVMEL
ncbi:MAG TPA: hypothetical protein PK986_08465, partial [Spirochaetota bacterium]|nr:hypothetical protein [Spirochaetota bacterium]